VSVHRLFIALPLPAHVKDAIGRAQEELRSALPAARARWTRREQLHVTLKFLGNVDAQLGDELTGTVARACARFGPLHLSARGLGMFPNPRRPRVIWVRVADRHERLGALHQIVESAAAAFTTETSEPAFTGHATLGRCSSLNRKETVTLATLAAEMEHREFGEWQADAVEIVQSELESGGSRHAVLAVLSL
jgi:RNA 2',3'-cyclic 3'-phosphodiesterase